MNVAIETSTKTFDNCKTKKNNGSLSKQNIRCIYREITSKGTLKIEEQRPKTGITSVIFGGIPTQQKSHTAENENSVPFSRIFLYAAIRLAEISNRIEFTMMKTRVRFCRNYYYNVVRYVHIPLVP